MYSKAIIGRKINDSIRITGYDLLQDRQEAFLANLFCGPYYLPLDLVFLWSSPDNSDTKLRYKQQMKSTPLFGVHHFI